MSTAMNFSSKSFTPRPPDKGAFPLDHFGECSAFKERFMECLRHSGYESAGGIGPWQRPRRSRGCAAPPLPGCGGHVIPSVRSARGSPRRRQRDRE
ncbi:PREDICTED: cytochrome c oxidase assembly protein COX19-like [Ficedula albicollis]|uniref:cytochrome c oxidase assembly protein COX19-like n=1 Tax=Ficedula albicollis TaxID=59894 RepID=UPI000359F615|nr:PREDICTED: cytochrome c oxidase assembly protein COX19-like [Ficedula albicollis]